MSKEIHIHGTVVSRGLGVGPLVSLLPNKIVNRPTRTGVKDLNAELLKFKRACQASLHDIEVLKQQLLREGLEEAAAIFEAHIQLLQDAFFTQQIETKIQKEQKSALDVLKDFLEELEEKFHDLDDPLFRERIFDLQDVIQRVAGHLKRRVRVPLTKLPHGAVVFSDHLTPSELALVRPGQIAALVTHEGSALSHVAVIAKSKKIPMLTHIDLSQRDLMVGGIAIVDAIQGSLFLNPCQITFDRYRSVGEKKPAGCASRHQIPFVSKTADAEQVKFWLSLGVTEEFKETFPSFIQGVGLLRTESLFLHQRFIPSEEEQFIVYRACLKACLGRPLHIRAFDWGGDKQIDFEEVSEPNPALGRRGLRLLLKKPEVFKSQLRAVLRVAQEGDVRLVLPMVTDLSEILATKELLNEVKSELESKSSLPIKSLLLGCMLEVPAAIIQADLLAEHVDFFSIGMNDLVQYTLAVDRANDLVSSYIKPTHASVLRLVSFAVKAAAGRGIPIIACGEIASCPGLLDALIGCGVRNFSINYHDLALVH